MRPPVLLVLKSHDCSFNTDSITSGGISEPTTYVSSRNVATRHCVPSSLVVRKRPEDMPIPHFCHPGTPSIRDSLAVFGPRQGHSSPVKNGRENCYYASQTRVSEGVVQQVPREETLGITSRDLLASPLTMGAAASRNATHRDGGTLLHT